MSNNPPESDENYPNLNNASRALKLRAAPNLSKKIDEKTKKRRGLNIHARWAPQARIFN